MSIPLNPVFFLLLTMALSACGEVNTSFSNNGSSTSAQDEKQSEGQNNSTEQQNSSEQQAENLPDTQDQLEEEGAVRNQYQIPDGFLKSLDYLPWLAEAGICHYRTQYMAMELAYAGLASHSLYIFGPLNPEPGITWFFHVSTLYVDPQTGDPYILDPLINDDRPLMLEEWLGAIGTTANENDYTYMLVEGSQTQGQPIRDESVRIDRQTLNQNLATINSTRQLNEMKPFSRTAINSSCFWVRQHWGILYGDRNVVEERQKLEERTAFLAGALGQLGMLDFNYLEDPLNCRLLR